MSSLHRVAFRVAIAIAPMLGTGCVIMAPQSRMVRSSERCELKMNSARLEETRGNLLQAKRLYAEIHQQHPQNAECLHRLAIVCTQLNEHSDADVYYLQSYAINPYNPELLSNMGYVAFLKKDYEKAEMLLEQSARINGNDRRNINNLAIVRAWRQKDEASLAAFRQIHTEADAIRHLAAIQLARGDQDRSRKNYDLAKRLDPSGSGSTEAIAQNAPANQIPMPPELPVVPPSTKPAPLPLSVSAFEWTPPIQQSSVSQAAVSKSTAVVEESVELPAPSPPDPVAKRKRHSGSRSRPSVLPIVHAVTVELPPLKTTVTEVVPPDQPAVVEVSNETPIAEVRHADVASTDIASPAEPQLVSRQPSVWRKTPESRGGFMATGNPDPVNAVGIQGTLNAPDAGRGKSGVRDICLVTLFEERRLSNALPEFVSEFQSQVYRFSSAEAKEKFQRDPKRYAPAAGGLDVVSVRNERSVDQGSLDFAVWYQRQLYLFRSSDHADAFRREPGKYVSTE